MVKLNQHVIFLDKLRETSIIERELGRSKCKSGKARPLRVDKGTSEQYGLRTDQTNELMSNIIQGAGGES